MIEVIQADGVTIARTQLSGDISGLSIAQRSEVDGIKNAKRRMERATVYRLLNHLLPDLLPILGHTPEGAPFLPGAGAPGVSVSHSPQEAVVALAPAGIPFGVDIQPEDRRMTRVASKFMTEEELAITGSGTDMLTAAWTVKEAVYKAAATPGLPLRCSAPGVTDGIRITSLKNLPDGTLRWTAATPSATFNILTLATSITAV